MSNQERILCLWSGGLDSTFMVQEYMRRNVMVDTLYVSLENNPKKTAREDSARDKIIAHWNTSRDARWLQNHTNVPFQIDEMNFALVQIMPFLVKLAEQVKHHHTKVAIGYVMNDDAISFLPEIQAIWNSFEPLMSHFVPLEFPLRKVNKNSIYRAMDKKLLDLVTWCEDRYKDESVYCGACKPCKRMHELDHHRFSSPIPAAESPIAEEEIPPLKSSLPAEVKLAALSPTVGEIETLTDAEFKAICTDQLEPEPTA